MSRVTATVLFTDLVGSTELRGRLGEEATEELRRTHDRLLTEAVERHDGRVLKGLGDGIMAAFAGAADAVAAVVAIQQAVDRLNRSGKAPEPLAVRTGLSAGDVTFEDDDVHGTPVIEASRLCAAAGGGEILVADVVRVLAGLSDDDVVDRGRLDLKGLHKPTVAWQICWEPAAVSPIPLPALLTDVGRIFVGRDTELERLGQLWKEAAAGERQVAFLAGEPGVGKTRLAAELAIQVHEEGGVVLAGRCDEDLGVPYQPFVEALRHFLDKAPAADLKDRLGRYGGELVRLVPELCERVADLPSPLQSDPETERYRLFDALAAWLSAVSAEDPLLLVLDDIQWAAKPTLLLLRHIVRAPDARRIFILGTYRDTELTHDHALVGLVADLRREAAVERFPLSGLDDLAVAALVEQAAGQALDEEGAALARAIYRETEGNPFFVREVLRHLVESNAIERAGGRWRTRVPIERLGIPEGIRDVIGRRLSRLSQEANHALRLAAVVGTEFDVDLVQAAGELDESRLLGGLDEAVAARLVSEASATRFRFSHALVRATLYESLTGARKLALHRHVAEAIEALHALALDDYLPALAHHWAKVSSPVGDATKAVDYAARAGDRALAQLAHDEAVAYYRQALELLELGPGAADEGRRLDLLISVGEAQRRAGDAAHRETLLAAARLAKERGDADALARAALANSRQGFISNAGRLDGDRVAVLESALDALGGGGAIRARLQATLAIELAVVGDSVRCRRLSDEALAEARRVGDPLTLAHVLTARPYSIASPATVSERAANADELEAMAIRIADPLMHAWARFHRYRANMELGAFSSAQADVDVLERLAGDLGQPILRWTAAWVRAAHLAAVGRLDEAERFERLAADIGATSGQPDVSIFTAANQYGIHFEQGRFADLHESIAKAVDFSPQWAPLKAMVALLDAEVGRLDEARGRFEQLAASDFADVPVNFAWFATTASLAMIATRLGDRRNSEVLHDRLLPYSDLIAGTPALWWGSVSQYLGMLATTLGRFDEAGARFAAAEATHERIGAPVWLARTRLEWARMLLTRRQPGDTDRAGELLSQALATARRLGLVKVERDAIPLLAKCP